MSIFDQAEQDIARGAATQDQEYRAYLSDLSEVANLPAGSRFLCALMEKLGAFEPSWTDKNARMARQVVLRDFGQDILDDLAVASDEVHDNIQRAMRVRRKAAGQQIAITQD